MKAGGFQVLRSSSTVQRVQGKPGLHKTLSQGGGVHAWVLEVQPSSVETLGSIGKPINPLEYKGLEVQGVSGSCTAQTPRHTRSLTYLSEETKELTGSHSLCHHTLRDWSKLRGGEWTWMCKPSLSHVLQSHFWCKPALRHCPPITILIAFPAGLLSVQETQSKRNYVSIILTKLPYLAHYCVSLP